MSRFDSPSAARFAVIDCGKNGHYTNSHQRGKARYMTKSHLKFVTPATVKRTVTPNRLPNADLRTREYLTEAEVERLMAAAKGNRWGHRDATMVLVGYRHGLRASELVDLRWDQVDFASATLHVRRVKQGTPAPTRSWGMSCGRCGDFSASRSPSRCSCSLPSGEHPSAPLGSPAWSSEQGPRPSRASRPHPHMLRHACGYALANKGHDTRALQAYLGHRNIQQMVRYTELSPTRFKDFWRS